MLDWYVLVFADMKSITPFVLSVSVLFSFFPLVFPQTAHAGINEVTYSVRCTGILPAKGAELASDPFTTTGYGRSAEDAADDCEKKIDRHFAGWGGTPDISDEPAQSSGTEEAKQPVIQVINRSDDQMIARQQKKLDAAHLEVSRLTQQVQQQQAQLSELLAKIQDLESNQK